jgi:hypothetical protein
MDDTNIFLRRWGGSCLIAAGLLFLVIGLATPMLDLGDPRRSPVFAFRQATAAVIALLMMFGSIGVYLRHPSRGRLLIRIAFLLACTGSALLLGHEWQELWLARTVDTQLPGTIDRLTAGRGLVPFEQGALLSISAYSVGWIALAAATARTTFFSRWGGPMFIIGLFAFPILSVVLPMPFGPYLAAPVIAAGLVRLGFDVRA